MPRPDLAATARVAAVVTTLLTGGTSMSEAADRPLADLRWQHRIVLLIADHPDDPDLQAQTAILTEARPGLTERDTLLITATTTVEIDGRSNPTLTPDTLRRAYAPDTTGFAVALIGKDGGVKLRSADPVPAREILGLIDSMPMRQRET